MADDDKGGQGGGQADDKGGQGGGQADGQGVTMAGVKALITEALKGGGGGKSADAHDVTAQVEAAVAKVHKGQEAASVMADIQARLKAVEDKPKPEKKPKEYRRITTRLWGADDDD